MSSEPLPIKVGDVGGYAELAARPNPSNLTLQYIPALVALLLNLERKNGAPLTQAQVEAIRDQASVMAVPADAAKAVEEKRGYQDLDPRDAWREWQVARKELQ
jgi:hypothetical protein